LRRYRRRVICLPIPFALIVDQSN